MANSSTKAVRSWGRVHAHPHQVICPNSLAQARRVIIDDGKPWLAHGMGRSYGDVATNAGGRLIDTKGLDRFIAFDRETGVIEAEAGVTLENVIRVALPHGWFLPTTPGTKYVSLGGAVANDVHGKNHHLAGTFGCWVKALELARSDGSTLTCTPQGNTDLFAATIGGLGMTGLITKVTLQLVKVPSAFLDSEDVAFADLDGFFALAEKSDTGGFEHTVSWMDCVGAKAGRGIFSRANWSTEGGYEAKLDGFKPSVPLDTPGFLLNRYTISAFNEFYFRMKAARAGKRRIHFNQCFYPLDGILDWNRLYGPRGFYQYQCVIPRQKQREGMAALLKEIAGSGQASFLVVIKQFGERPSPGLLSFPMPGTHLALDFPNRGARTLKLFGRMDRIVSEAGGRIYPAKDARMPPSLFRSGYPEWSKVAAAKDPHVHSNFWSRVAE